MIWVLLGTWFEALVQILPTILVLRLARAGTRCLLDLPSSLQGEKESSSQ